MLFTTTRRPSAFDRDFAAILESIFHPPVGAPGISVKQRGDDWELSVDVPGVQRDQLAIEVDGSVVRITTTEGAPRTYRLAYELPAEIDADRAKAKLENGVLTLTLARKKAETLRQIKID